MTAQKSTKFKLKYSKLVLYNISFDILTVVLAILEKYDRVDSGRRNATQKRIEYKLCANGTFNPESFNFPAKSSSVFARAFAREEIYINLGS